MCALLPLVSLQDVQVGVQDEWAALRRPTITIQVSLAVLLKTQMSMWLTCRMRKPGLRRRRLA